MQFLCWPVLRDPREGSTEPRWILWCLLKVVLCSPHKLWLQSNPDRFLAFTKLLISTKLAEVAELQLAGGLKNSLGETERQVQLFTPSFFRKHS